MDHTALVGVIDGVANPAKQLQPLPSRDLVLTDILVEGDARHELHRKEVLPIPGTPGLIYRGDGRMPQAGQSLSFTLKQPDAVLVRRPPPSDHLDGNLPLRCLLLALVYDPHAPFPQPSVDHV